MSTAAKTTPAAAEAATTQVSLLELAVANTRNAERPEAEDLLKNIIGEALKGTIVYKKDVTRSITEAVKLIDQKVSKQLAAVMHDPKFQKLEGSWRGLHHLVKNSETGEKLKLRVLNCTQEDLKRDLEKAIEFDQSEIWKKVHDTEFGMPGGTPYGALVGDYEFENHPEHIQFLKGISTVAAAAFCPFLSAASPKLMELDSFSELAGPRDLAKIFDNVKYADWKSFRDSPDSRFVALTMPRVLSRLPYGKATKPTDDAIVNFEEVDASKPVPHKEYTWMNAAYVLASRLTAAFSKTGFCTAIRGKENGGKVEDLPSHTFLSEDGDVDQKCPTEVGIGDRREAELSKLGFLPLCHYKNTNYAVFFGGQTTQKSVEYDRPDATANAKIMARLPYILATSRFSHYLKIMARDMIGSAVEEDDIQRTLDRWIHNYVSDSKDPTVRAKFPLKDASVTVEPIAGSPGSYNAVVYMRPWLQMEELTASMRMVAKIPKFGGG